MKKIEKEYKVLINKNEFEEIIYKYNFKKNIQINYYYDTIPSLESRNIALRIREINNKFIFTLKQVINNDVFEYEIDIKENNIELKEIKDILSSLNINEKLYPIGNLKTTRYTMKDKFGELCIDKNEYFDIIDYEIEYELLNYSDNKLEHFINILKLNNIKYKENKISKIKRFKNRMIQLKTQNN